MMNGVLTDAHWSEIKTGAASHDGLLVKPINRKVTKNFSCCGAKVHIIFVTCKLFFEKSPPTRTLREKSSP